MVSRDIRERDCLKVFVAQTRCEAEQPWYTIKNLPEASPRCLGTNGALHDQRQADNTLDKRLNACRYPQSDGIADIRNLVVVSSIVIECCVWLTLDFTLTKSVLQAIQSHHRMALYKLYCFR